MEFRAEMRYLRVSPQKARLVLELIKGRRVEEARNTLLFTKKRVAAHVGKLLQSALDNANFLSAEKNLDIELDNLYVVDTSFFPSIAAVNPALTAMANALRVGDHLLQRLGADGG